MILIILSFYSLTIRDETNQIDRHQCKAPEHISFTCCEVINRNQHSRAHIRIYTFADRHGRKIGRTKDVRVFSGQCVRPSRRRLRISTGRRAADEPRGRPWGNGDGKASCWENAIVRRRSNLEDEQDVRNWNSWIIYLHLEGCRILWWREESVVTWEVLHRTPAWETFAVW